MVIMILMAEIRFIPTVYATYHKKLKQYMRSEY